MWDAELYGNYRNRTFADIYPEVDQFEQDYADFNTGMLDNGVSGTALYTIWMLLHARYGNSTVASANEEQFKLKLFTTIFMYGPTWEKRLEIQKQIREMDIDEIRQGGKAIYNTALNPGQKVVSGDDPNSGTNTLTELKYINQQNTTNYKKSLPEAYSILIELLNTDVTSKFLAQFAKLFLKVVTPEVPLWYITDTDQYTGGGSATPQPIPPAPGPTDEELKAEIERLKARIAELEAIIDSSDDQLQQKVEELTAENAQLQDNLNRITPQYNEMVTVLEAAPVYTGKRLNELYYTKWGTPKPDDETYWIDQEVSTWLASDIWTEFTEGLMKKYAGTRDSKYYDDLAQKAEDALVERKALAKQYTDWLESFNTRCPAQTTVGDLQAGQERFIDADITAWWADRLTITQAMKIDPGAGFYTPYYAWTQAKPTGSFQANKTVIYTKNSLTTWLATAPEVPEDLK